MHSVDYFNFFHYDTPTIHRNFCKDIKIFLLGHENQEFFNYVNSVVQIKIYNCQKEIGNKILKYDDIPRLIFNETHFDIITQGNKDREIIITVRTIPEPYKINDIKKENSTKNSNISSMYPDSVNNCVFRNGYHNRYSRRKNIKSNQRTESKFS